MTRAAAATTSPTRLAPATTAKCRQCLRGSSCTAVVWGAVLHLGLVAGPLATEPGAGLAGVVAQVRVEGEAGGGEDGEGGDHGHHHQDR